VVIGAKSSKERFNESVELFNYGFANFTNEQVVKSDEFVGKIEVKRSTINEIEVYPSENFYALIKKGSNSEYAITQDIKSSINAPIKSGEVVGSITVSKNGVVVKEIPLVIKSDVKALSFGQAFNKVIKAW
ncbi:MAG: hypothetical protein PHX27_04880, partial [Candidatus ainarchaeum sp.]|nr:hypothetical protein [Candidatus ainarchaeum sp.]